MLQVFAELAERQQGHKLPGPHAHQGSHGSDHQPGQHVIEQMVAVVAPHRHLPLRVVQGMQGPPPAQLVLAAVNPVLHQIEQHQVQHKAHPGLVSHPRPQPVQVPGGHALGTQQPQPLLEQGIQAEEHGQLEQAQAVDQGVQDIGAHGPVVVLGFGGPQPLHRPDQHQHEGDLDQPDQQPSGAFVGFFQQMGLAGKQGQRLHQVLEQPLLGPRKSIGQHIHDRIIPRCARPLQARGAGTPSRGSPGARARWQSTARGA